MRRRRGNSRMAVTGSNGKRGVNVGLVDIKVQRVNVGDVVRHTVTDSIDVGKAARGIESPEWVVKPLQAFSTLRGVARCPQLGHGGKQTSILHNAQLPVREVQVQYSACTMSGRQFTKKKTRSL